MQGLMIGIANAITGIRSGAGAVINFIWGTPTTKNWGSPSDKTWG